MMVVGFTYLAWIFFSPVNLMLQFPVSAILNTLIYAPVMYHLVRKWLKTMTKRKGGPAAGIDVVESSRAIPEAGDQWGTATRPYSAQNPPKIIGPKSEIREPPLGIDAQFFVKLPDLDTGEELFDRGALMSRAMIRSRVTTGGWIRKRVSSRGAGSLKVSEKATHGRPLRSRVPVGYPTSIHVPASVIAAITRSGRHSSSKRIKMTEADLRENVFTGRMPLTVILVVDVSMSMKGSMEEVRRILERIETETRGSRDRAGVIAFKDNGAIEVQPPTSNWNRIYRALSRLRLSGLTPLAEGMMKALETIRRERMRDPSIEPLVVLISDFAPNIPLAQSAGPGHQKYTPVYDVVKASRLLKREKIRLVAISVDPEQAKWSRILKLPYHDALELAATLRMRKENLHDPVETVLAVPEFRREFGAFLIARVAGGRAFLSREVLQEDSVIGSFLKGTQTRSRLRAEDLMSAESYISR